LSATVLCARSSCVVTVFCARSSWRALTARRASAVRWLKGVTEEVTMSDRPIQQWEQDLVDMWLHWKGKGKGMGSPFVPVGPLGVPPKSRPEEVPEPAVPPRSAPAPKTSDPASSDAEPKAAAKEAPPLLVATPKSADGEHVGKAALPKANNEDAVPKGRGEPPERKAPEPTEASAWFACGLPWHNFQGCFSSCATGPSSKATTAQRQRRRTLT